MAKSAKSSSSSPALMMIAAVAAIALLAYVAFRYMKTSREQFATGGVTYFYLQNCPWCQKFKPEWEKFKVEAGKAGILTREVDGEAEKELIATKGIKGFPTIMVADVEYTGDRTAAALLAAAKASKA